MKISRSILILLFVSSIIVAFSYALNRTNGNVLKSLQFALYFLAIKIGLIAPNILLELNQYQPNQELVSRVQLQPPPIYNPYVSVLGDYRPSGLYMDNIYRPVSQHYLSYHSQSVINELRAGDSRLTQAAWLLITIWMLQQQQSAGFQPVRQASPPPHIESARNLLFGKPKADQSSCRRLSMFDSQQFENQEKFVMSKQEALNVLDNTFTGSKIISETEKISDWQMAKKVYHLNGLGVNPEEYGMSKAEVNSIRKDGLVKYTMNGGKLLPIELIRAGQNRIHDICYNDTTAKKEEGTFGKQDQPSSLYYNTDTRYIIYFNKDDGDLIMGEKFREAYFNRSLIKNNINIKEN
jgi:hypothetical protein